MYNVSTSSTEIGKLVVNVCSVHIRGAAYANFLRSAPPLVARRVAAAKRDASHQATVHFTRFEAG